MCSVLIPLTLVPTVWFHCAAVFKLVPEPVWSREKNYFSSPSFHEEMLSVAQRKKNCYHCSIQCLQASVLATTTLDVATAVWSCDSVMGCDWFSLELFKIDPREFRLKYAANLLPHGVSSIVSARLGHNCEYADIFRRYSVENSYQNISNASLKST